MQKELWVYDPCDDFHNAGGKAYICGQEAEVVCVVEGGRRDRATLIAAAPDLLAACKEAFAFIRDEHGNGPTSRLLARVIGKAEGGAA